MSISIKCQGCGVQFEALRIIKRWCDECYRKRRKEQQGRYEHHGTDPCPRCGGAMVRRASLCRSCDNKDRAVRHLGENNPNWHQGRTRDKFGYVHVRVSATAKGTKAYRREHLVVWEAAHGPIPKGWLVHHLNGIKDDNRIENLVAMSRSQHHRNHHEPWEERIRALEQELRMRPAELDALIAQGPDALKAVLDSGSLSDDETQRVQRALSRMERTVEVSTEAPAEEPSVAVDSEPEPKAHTVRRSIPRLSTRKKG